MDVRDTKFNIDQISFENSEEELNFLKNQMRLEEALEKVRSKTMTIQDSSELSDVASILFQQIERFGPKPVASAFIIGNKEERNGEIYISADGSVIPESFTIPYRGEPVQDKIFKSWLNEDDFTIIDLKGDALLNHLSFINENMPVTEMLDSGSSPPPSRLALHIIHFKYGFLGINYLKPIEEILPILLRFAEVFEQTYTRFLDLQKAEGQAREAQVESALEVIRSRTMAMHKSDELSEIVSLMFSKMKLHGVAEWGTNIILCHEDKEVFEYWLAEERTSDHSKNYFASATEHPVMREMWKLWKTQGPSLMIHHKNEVKKKFDEYWINETDFRDLPDDVKASVIEQDEVFLNFVSMKYGLLNAVGYIRLSEHQLDILTRFAQVFEQTYTRFLDLQKVERQAREAQIEAALERIRSKSIAMRKSDELSGLSLELVKQVQKLGIETWFCAFNIYDEDSSWEWGCNGENVFPKYRTPREGIFLKYYERGQKGETLFINEIGEEDCPTHYEYLCSLPGVGKQLLTMKENGIDFPSSQIDHVAFFKYGYIIFISYDPVPAAHDIFIRFSSIFEQSYTRFLDLQKAEAQAREAQIEAALERIRGQVTSMQDSSDLLKIMVNMRKEFVSLGHEAHYFWHMRWLPEVYEKAMTSEDGQQIGMVMTLPRSIHAELETVANWEKSDEPTFVLAMETEFAVDYVDKMIRYGNFERLDPQAPTLDDIRQIKGLTFVMARTTHGEIGFSLPGYVPEPSEEAIATLVRFAAVFDLAYKRFEDLKKVEKDIIEIKLAKLKAEETLAELKATQAQLIQQEKLASLGQLTAGIAHEIKNPLNFVTNFSELSTELIEEIDEEMKKETNEIDFEMILEILEDIKTNLDKILHHGKRADGIVKSMLQHSRSSSGQQELVKINPIIKEYVNLAFHGMRAGKVPINVALKFDLDETIQEVPLIIEDFSRVILNLCNNAFDAMRDLTLNQNGFRAELSISTINKKEKILIEISDNGPGISDDLKEKILQPFFTTKKGTEGTGLGLSITNDIIKAHRGTFEIDSKPKQGATFKIFLPY